VTELLIATIITLSAQFYGVPPEYAMCIAQAESNLDPSAVGDNGDALGLYQWHVAAWTETRAKMGLDPDPALRADPYEATNTAMYAMGVLHDWYKWSTDAGCAECRGVTP
jgi:soluble lytic murein transglycosylase-like protein